VLDGEKNYHAWFKDVFLLEEANVLGIDPKTGTTEKRTYWNPYTDSAKGNNERSTHQFFIQLIEQQ